MKNTIDIDIQIDPSCSDPKVIIRTDRMTPDIDNIVHAIESSTDSAYPMVTAYAGDTMVLLELDNPATIEARSAGDMGLLVKRDGGLPRRRPCAARPSTR